jgi:predicted nucleic acid-binding protein
MIQRYHINAADALHVVIAEVADCDYFITADKALTAALRKGKSKIKPIYINTIKPRSKFFKDIQ